MLMRRSIGLRVDKLNHKMSLLWHDLSLGFIIMMNRMTKRFGPLSNVADRHVRLNPKGLASIETYKG